MCGPAGSGKTHRVLDGVRDLLAAAGGRLPRFQVLVPTYSQAEHLKRRLLRHVGTGAILDRGIGTFEQLAERRTGVRLGSLASGAVCDAVLAASFAEADVPAFRDVSRFPGLRRAALRLLDEIRATESAPGEDALAAATERLGVAAAAFAPERRERLAGLLRVLAIHQRRLRDAGLLDHGDLLRALLRSVRESTGDRLDLLAIDGFTDLTTVQERIVHALAANAERTVVTALDDGATRPGCHFAAADPMRRRFLGAGFTPELLGPSRRLVGDLARVERRLAGGPPWNDADADGAPGAAAGSGGGRVRLLAGADPEDEADRVARTCLRWTAEGLARSEILVVVRSAESGTADRVLAALARHGVPARRIGRSPIAGFPWVRSALRCMRLLAGTAAADDALDAVRGGDARDVPCAEGDRLAIAARTMATRSEADLHERARELALAGAARWLARLHERRCGPGPQAPSALAAHLLSAVGDLIRLPFEDGVPADDEERTALDAAAVRTLRDLTADLVRALRTAGTPRVTPSDFVERLASAAESARAAPADLRDDVVHVVGAEEARQWEVRAVVLAGARLGEFPGPAREDLFLSDDERRTAQRSAGIALPPRLDDALQRERLLFYFAVTRATTELVVTVPLADASGGPVLPSPFLECLREALPPRVRALHGAERTPGDLRPAAGETLHAADLERIALAALSERFVEGTASELRPATGYALLPHLVGAPDSAIVAAAAWAPRRDAELREGSPARAALARPRPRSASSLSDFAQCAYRHFASRGLGLSELPAGTDDGVCARLAGTIAHAALETAMARPRLDRAAAVEAFEAAWNTHAGHLRIDLRAAALRGELREAVVGVVLREAERPRAEGFRPAAFEWGFGRPGEPQVAVGGDSPVRLAGSVDRIDEGPDGTALVLDYKWARHDRYRGIEREIDAGAELQLPIYALAVGSAYGRRVVAVGYLTLRDGRERWLAVTGGAPVDVGKTPQPRGWGEGDGSAALARAAGHIVELDRRIRLGGIAPEPRDPARCGPGRCPFADLCRFEGAPR